MWDRWGASEVDWELAGWGVWGLCSAVLEWSGVQLEACSRRYPPGVSTGPSLVWFTHQWPGWRDRAHSTSLLAVQWWEDSLIAQRAVPGASEGLGHNGGSPPEGNGDGEGTGASIALFRRGWESWECSASRVKGWEGILSTYLNILWEGVKVIEPGSFQWFQQQAQTNTGSSILIREETSLLCRWQSTGTGCPERLWGLLLQSYLKPAWMSPHAMCSRWPYLSRDVRPDDLQRSFHPQPLCEPVRAYISTSLKQSCCSSDSCCCMYYHICGNAKAAKKIIIVSLLWPISSLQPHHLKKNLGATFVHLISDITYRPI